MKTVLLIDGKNTVYRSVYATRQNRDVIQKGYHPFALWMRFTHQWIEKFKPHAMHVFWDCPKDNVWRKRILEDYKAQRGDLPHYSDEIQTVVHQLINAAQAILPYMAVRQFGRKKQECDDLIYSACRMLTPIRSDTIKLIVISSDADFNQLSWSMPHVRCYNPLKQELVDLPEVNPVIQKALMGDKSDNIEGYRGVGPVTAKKYAEDFSKLIEFLDSVGSDKLKRNMALIDLSLNPARVNNELYVVKVLAEEVKFDKSAIKKAIIENKVKGLMADFNKIIAPFERLK